MMILRLALVVLSLILPSLSTAADGEIPGLYRVVGVASNDTLNVRSGQGASHAKVGELAFNARWVEIIAISGNRKWGQTNIGETSGWVSMRYLRPVATEGYALGHALACHGTEPFWGLDIVQGQTATLGTPEGDREFSVGLLQPGRGRPDRFWLRGFSGAQSVTAMIRKAACNDGMSDREFGLDADLLIEDGGDVYMYSGCCNLVP